jgi:cytochrome c oxidase subunit 2
MEQLNFFHDWTIVFVAGIAASVLWYLRLLVFSPHTHRWLVDAQNVEFCWTAFPCLVLVAIAIPSLKLLYIIDERGTPAVTLKAVGHQWYWSYEYSDFGADFDSYMAAGAYRLLDTDHRVLVPTHLPVRVLVTAADVLHSWTVPAIGIKADGIPGRLNELNFLADRAGLYFGQCREICGSNHRFMPITLETVPAKAFRKVVLQ